MRGSAVFRTSVAPGGALAGPWVKNELWRRARAVPSLDLRFAENKSLVDATTGTNLVDFTRASSGTYVGSDGLIKTATTNYFLYSEDLQNGFAVKAGVQNPIPSDTVPGPFSGTLADEMLETATTGGHYLEKNTGEPGDRTWTYSVYVKRIGNPRIVWLTLYANGYTSLINGSYDLDAQSANTTTPQGTGTPISADILPIGDGWFRLSLTGIPTTASVSDLKPRVVLINNSTVYLGETNTGLYAWGAQLEQSSTVGEYIPTTSTINSAPRFDHDPTTGESLGLLVEESRINRFQWSNSAVNGETWNNVGALLNLQTGATGPAGGTNGIIASDATNLNTGTFLQRLTVDATLPANTVVTYSVWVKPISTPNDVVILNLFANGVTDSLAALFTNNNGVLAFSSSVVTGTAVFSGASSIPYANGWYRLVLTGIPSTTVGSDMRARINLGSYQQVQGTPRFYWYGAQLETGLAGSPAAPFVTSYIPTVGSTVTRAADVASISGSNFSSWYRQDAGSIYLSNINQRPYSGANNFSYALQFDATDNNNRIHIDNGVLSNGQRYLMGVIENGNTQASFNLKTGIDAGTENQVAIAYAVNDFAGSVNGEPVNKDTLGILPLSVNRLQIGNGTGGQLTGTISRMVYWGVRLPDNALQAVTQ